MLYLIPYMKTFISVKHLNGLQLHMHMQSATIIQYVQWKGVFSEEKYTIGMRLYSYDNKLNYINLFYYYLFL